MTPPPALIDAHCHLADPRLLPFAEDCLQRARSKGVATCVINGTSPADWPLVANLTRRFPNQVVPFYGLHPWKVQEASPDWFDQLLGCLQQDSRAGIGEIGLDRWIEPRDEALQEKCFLLQWELARQLQRPCTVHCLRAWGWFDQLLRQHQAPPAGFLLHSYAGPPEMIPGFARRGAYFSFSAALLEERRHHTREAFLKVPDDRLLLETDAPDMPFPREKIPAPLVAGSPGHQPSIQMTARFPNEPSNLPILLKFAAKLRGIPSERLAALTTANAQRFVNTQPRQSHQGENPAPENRSLRT